MVPQKVHGPNLKKAIHPFPLGSKNISLYSFSNTLNFKHTIHFQANLLNFKCTKKLCFVPTFRKGAYHGKGMPFPTPSPLVSTEMVPLPPIVLQSYILGARIDVNLNFIMHPAKPGFSTAKFPLVGGGYPTPRIYNTLVNAKQVFDIPCTAIIVHFQL